MNRRWPQEVTRTLAGQRREAAQRAVDALGSVRYIDLLDRLHAAAGAPPFLRGPGKLNADARATSVLPTLIDKQCRPVRRRVRKAGRKPLRSPIAPHQDQSEATPLCRGAGDAGPGKNGETIGEGRRSPSDTSRGTSRRRGCRSVAPGLGPPVGSKDPTGSPSHYSKLGHLAANERHRQRKLRRQWRATWVKLTKRMSVH